MAITNKWVDYATRTIWITSDWWEFGGGVHRMQWVWTDEDKATLYNMFEQGHWGADSSYVVPATPHSIAACDVMGLTDLGNRPTARIFGDHG
jgi:hypothetical protein